MFNQKDLAKQQQTSQLQAFRLGRQQYLNVAAISKVPRILFSNKTNYYRKEEIALDNAGVLHFIKKNDETESFVWHAPTEALKKALYYGLIPVESPTAKAIAALGIYRHAALIRAYDKGIISNKHQQKEALVTAAQDNIASLQGLERLVNSFNACAPLEAEKERINAIILSTLDKLTQQINNAENNFDNLNDFDRDAVQKMIDFYIKQSRSLEQYQLQIASANAEQLNNMLKATGVHSVMTLVKTLSMAALVKIQELNQNISYSRKAKSLLRGDLNSACEDALKVLRDYEADPHNPISAEHQGYFLPAPTEKTVGIDFSHLGHNEKKIKNTLQAIIEISGQGITRFHSPPKNNYTLGGTPLLTTRFTKWQTNAAKGFFILRISAGIINIIVGALVGLTIDLPIGFLTGILSLGRYKMPSLAAQLTIHVDTGAPKNTLASKLYSQFTIKPYSAGVILGQKLGAFFSETALDIATGIWQSAKNLQFKGFEELSSDFKTGAWDHENNSDKLLRAQSKLQVLTARKTALEREITENESRVVNRYAPPDLVLTSSTRMAIPSYHLSSGEWDDVSNASISGLIALFETFIHNINAKHPFTGLIFLGTYATGGLAILFPSLMTFLTGHYLAFCQLLGNAMAQGTSSTAIAVGFTQAKLFAATFEAFLHGGDSWLAIGARQFEQNPANTLVYGAIAVGLGYSLANYLSVPWLSQYIQEDTGNMPEIGWAFAGGKIGLLLIEILEQRHQDDKTAATSLITELEQELKLIHPKAQQPQIEAIRKNLLTQTKNIILETRRLQFLHLLQQKKDVLAELDNISKRELMIIARDVFKEIANHDAALRSVKEALYPQAGKSIFTRTITLITDYIPLLTRCLLSPISASLQPWRDLHDKIIKDTTRIAHGLSKLFNSFVKMFIRTTFRGPADVLGNEIAARFDALINPDHHTVSAQTYKLTTSYEKIFEETRQAIGTAVDIPRRAATAPAIETVLSQSQQQTITQLSAKHFFSGNTHKNDTPGNQEALHEIATTNTVTA